MKVNDLLELLEYSPPRAPVSVAFVAPDGHVVEYAAPRFLLAEDRVFLVVDQRPDQAGSPGTDHRDLALSDYELPQVFGQRLILVRKSP